MIYKDGNWAFNDYIINGAPLNLRPLPDAVEGDVFISCNFTRASPYTKMYENISDLTFLNCNLNGVDVSTKWIVDDKCSFAQNEYIHDDGVL